MSGSVDLALSYQTMSQSKIVIHIPMNKGEEEKNTVSVENRAEQRPPSPRVTIMHDPGALYKDVDGP